MGLFKQIKELYKNNDPVELNNPSWYKKKEKLPWNIYEPHQELGKHLKKFKLFHYLIKYKVIVPLVLIFNRFYLKRIKVDIKDLWYNKNIQIFNEEYERSIKDWSLSFRYHTPKGKTKKKGNKLNKFRKQIDEKLSCVILRAIKDIITTGYLLDTAYREFGNILLLNLSKRMQKEYTKKKEYHLFYTSNHISDPEYLIIGALLNPEDKNSRIYKVNNRGKQLLVELNLKEYIKNYGEDDSKTAI